MKILKSILTGIGVIAVIGVSIQAVQDAPTAPKNENTEVKVVNDYNVYALPLPDNLNFAGEPVPVQNPDIKERMDRELLVNTYWQSNGLLLFKRANKYFPIIEPILKEEGVPEDLKYLAVIESGLTQAVSPARATGFWQILKETGKEYGLEVNDNVDERYHIEKSTRAACKYLKASKERFGSWTLAAAAYNAGNYGVSREMERQNVNGYYDLLLGEETGRYVFRILALKEILSNPGKYGFNFQEKDLYTEVPTYKVSVDTAVSDFTKFAEGFGINYKILKIHNPWLREKHLNNSSRKKYSIDIPEEGYYTTP
ncbi:lytic transglycosylase domain-containing protein [Croceibacter atlanticus]|uniref:Putative membrane-bound lytic murein transglycosylase n=1 Tax=Croceibacter atlanticus (strain ATCC BAA-628 / JCM 21780 / CIP 108009 / IAM 15332 / KCTC 12090 / HTCC2559) TaxID=216432 RepID=A3UAU4_CROAH|nr:lytic transglycosylase domain-containing protein [Croceibacter atlanticus]EAP86930.1 putative membrane-bound lytic murein transglycosylase [Croceibacter atlanticus HTCC2559]MBW4970571.1 lytic transglycosylase domain-containing protein [Croceibacter atlanticus]